MSFLRSLRSTLPSNLTSVNQPHSQGIYLTFPQTVSRTNLTANANVNYLYDNNQNRYFSVHTNRESTSKHFENLSESHQTIARSKVSLNKYSNPFSSHFKSNTTQQIYNISRSSYHDNIRTKHRFDVDKMTTDMSLEREVLSDIKNPTQFHSVMSVVANRTDYSISRPKDLMTAEQHISSPDLFLAQKGLTIAADSVVDLNAFSVRNATTVDFSQNVVSLPGEIMGGSRNIFTEESDEEDVGMDYTEYSKNYFGSVTYSDMLQLQLSTLSLAKQRLQLLPELTTMPLSLLHQEHMLVERFEYLIDYYCYSGHLDQAVILFNEMRLRYRVIPSSKTYLQIMSVLKQSPQGNVLNLKSRESSSSSKSLHQQMTALLDLERDYDDDIKASVPILPVQWLTLSQLSYHGQVQSIVSNTMPEQISLDDDSGMIAPTLHEFLGDLMNPVQMPHLTSYAEAISSSTDVDVASKTPADDDVHIVFNVIKNEGKDPVRMELNIDRAINEPGYLVHTLAPVFSKADVALSLDHSANENGEIELALCDPDLLSADPYTYDPVAALSCSTSSQKWVGINSVPVTEPIDVYDPDIGLNDLSDALSPQLLDRSQLKLLYAWKPLFRHRLHDLTFQELRYSTMVSEVETMQADIRHRKLAFSVASTSSEETQSRKIELRKLEMKCSHLKGCLKATPIPYMRTKGYNALMTYLSLLAEMQSLGRDNIAQSYDHISQICAALGWSDLAMALMYAVNVPKYTVYPVPLYAQPEYETKLVGVEIPAFVPFEGSPELVDHIAEITPVSASDGLLTNPRKLLKAALLNGQINSDLFHYSDIPYSLHQKIWAQHTRDENTFASHSLHSKNDLIKYGLHTVITQVKPTVMMYNALIASLFSRNDISNRLAATVKVEEPEYEELTKRDMKKDFARKLKTSTKSLVPLYIIENMYRSSDVGRASLMHSELQLQKLQSDRDGLLASLTGEMGISDVDDIPDLKVIEEDVVMVGNTEVKVKRTGAQETKALNDNQTSSAIDVMSHRFSLESLMASHFWSPSYAFTDCSPEPSALTYNLVLELLFDQGMEKEALDLICREFSRNRPCATPQQYFISLSVESAARQGDWSTALWLINNLHNIGMMLPVSMYTLVAHSATKLQSKQGQNIAIKILDYVKCAQVFSQHSGVDEILYATVLNACVNWKVALRLLVEMELWHVQPQYRNFSSVISLCLKSGLTQQADHITQLMNEYMDQSAYNADTNDKQAISDEKTTSQLNALVSAKNLEGAYERLIALLRTSSPPTVSHYGLVLKACANATPPNTDTAHKVFTLALKNDEVDRIDLWSTYATTFQRAGDWAHVLGFFHFAATLSNQPCFLPLTPNPKFNVKAWTSKVSRSLSFDMNLLKSTKGKLPVKVITECYNQAAGTISSNDMFDMNTSQLHFEHCFGDSIRLNYKETVPFKKSRQYCSDLIELNDEQRTGLQVAARHYQDFLRIYYKAVQEKDVILIQKDGSTVTSSGASIGDIHSSNMGVSLRTMIKVPQIDRHFMNYGLWAFPFVSCLHGLALFEYMKNAVNMVGKFTSDKRLGLSTHEKTLMTQWAEDLLPNKVSYSIMISSLASQKRFGAAAHVYAMGLTKNTFTVAWRYPGLRLDLTSDQSIYVSLAIVRYGLYTMMEHYNAKKAPASDLVLICGSPASPDLLLQESLTYNLRFVGLTPVPQLDSKRNNTGSMVISQTQLTAFFKKALEQTENMRFISEMYFAKRACAATSHWMDKIADHVIQHSDENNSMYTLNQAISFAVPAQNVKIGFNPTLTWWSDKTEFIKAYPRTENKP